MIVIVLGSGDSVLVISRVSLASSIVILLIQSCFVVLSIILREVDEEVKPLRGDRSVIKKDLSFIDRMSPFSI